MDFYAIGDIHSQYFKLKALVDRLNIKSEDKLIVLGDYIDRGDMAFEVIEYLIALNRLYSCVFLMGNHEEMFLDYLSGIHETIFIQNGGQKTISSYEMHGYDINRYTDYSERFIPIEHMEFFRSLKMYHEEEDFIFVHAGISPRSPLDKLPNDILLWDRGFSHIKYKGKVVVYGHSPNRKILNEKYKICIDTGACFESMGDLTAVKLPERTFTRQGWTLEDIDYGNGNESPEEKDDEDIFTHGQNLPKPGKGSWSV